MRSYLTVRFDIFKISRFSILLHVSLKVARLVYKTNSAKLSKMAMFLRYAYETLLNIKKKKVGEVMRFKPKITIELRDLSL